mmetsp:Transcript_21443/g.47027  ORF Transcript_21443/g.47027 Transcript_21443/m.47027 type:complete len:272 (+) Transcript_21443:369-1184(+)
MAVIPFEHAAGGLALRGGLLQHPEHRARHVRDVAVQHLLALLPVLCRLRAHELGLELQRAQPQRLLHALCHGRRVLPDVLLTRALEGDLGGDDGDEDPHAVAVGVDLVGVPLELARGARGHVVPALEQQRDAVRVPEHRQPRGDALAAQAHPRLHHERVALVDRDARVAGGHHGGPQLLHDAQAQVVLARGAQAVPVRRVEVRRSQQLVDAHHLLVAHLFDTGIRLQLLPKLPDEAACVLPPDGGELLVQELQQVARLGGVSQGLQQLDVH